MVFTFLKLCRFTAAVHSTLKGHEKSKKLRQFLILVRPLGIHKKRKKCHSEGVLLRSATEESVKLRSFVSLRMTVSVSIPYPLVHYLFEIKSKLLATGEHFFR